MGTAKNLLVELFVEELPPKALKALGEAFGQQLLAGLKAAGLAGEGSALNVYASPRRLAAHVSHVLPVAADRAVSVKLMPVAVGLAADGTPTPALLKKLAGLGADASAVPGLKRQPDGKAEALYLDSTVPGASLRDGLQAALDAALAKLPIPKVMQYQLADGWTSVNFVRPAHGLVALHGAEVVPVQALGLVAGRQTRGHRFEAPVDPVVLQDADHYETVLETQGAVIASFAKRRAEIQRQLAAAAAAVGASPVDDEALLDEVTALVERPNVVTGAFEPAFLAVPQECLILTMKANQKYFPLLDAQGRLTHRFLVVANVRPADPSRVIQGNERVVRPRLADAKFFFDQDRKRTLASRVAGLDKVVYHGKLGSQGQRTGRVREIARAIVRQLGAHQPASVQSHDELQMLAHKVDQAAQLAKADLLTDMVGEFPELQGIMGGYYARHEGLRDGVAIAIEDHYKPRFAGDALPRNHTGTVLALADKLETLVGLFGIGQLPTGDKDPFALRRHALGVIRILAEKNLPLDLPELVTAAFDAFHPAVDAPADAPPPVGGLALAPDTVAAVCEFVWDRLAVNLRDQGYRAQEVEAVLALRPGRLGEVARRLAAVRAFAALPEAAALAGANKRVSNLLKKAEGGGAGPAVDPARLVEPAEQALAAALADVAGPADAAFERGDHGASLQALAALKGPVDAFFEQVMVNAEDPALRANRLALLARLHGAMNRVADLSRLAA
ncbi:glycine--tRNA ligase subunit beta [Piscinibacter sakaiensis]|uniref:Glycine--tRNA ligase beta subunit n=1 Tax=Piscinibacter sakaiensis TaxID=1547922 RepID=A0A0K8NXK2_PISS1|nr:glycine--tRNA ligase subunit beta [Piscinibacter sakaiensis]GAP35132.1 glycyl-tRNA synthetase, beta chain [Piscinibacter sakaiensis]